MFLNILLFIEHVFNKILFSSFSEQLRPIKPIHSRKGWLSTRMILLNTYSVFFKWLVLRNEIVCPFVRDIRAASLLNSTIGGQQDRTLPGGFSPALSRSHSFTLWFAVGPSDQQLQKIQQSTFEPSIKREDIRMMTIRKVDTSDHKVNNALLWQALVALLLRRLR